ncbi:MAG: hypothetical protein IKS45_06050 [Thermoguttaceae bacterium]|nr:hypothetical protein [Thermoguttaceae bacterium]MBR6436050.1 hypothetical protein [Thermoguttaceae bacterium]
MTNETSVILFPEGDMELEGTLIHLYVMRDKGFDVRTNTFIDDFDLETLYSWCLIDKDSNCSYWFRVSPLGNKLLIKFTDGWYRQENRPWYKEKPCGTLREFFERDEDFRKRLERLLQKRRGIIPPAVPSAPVAAVPAVSNSPAVPDCLIPVQSVASRERVTSKTAEVKPVFDESSSRLLETVEGIAQDVKEMKNGILSINMKTVGKITRVEDIPPYNLTVKNWVSVARYAEITGISRENLDSMRNRRDNKTLDNNSGIHGEHCWRRVNGRVFYFVYQTQYLDLL